MKNLIAGMIVMLVGVLIIIFRDRFTRSTLNSQHKTFGFKYDQIDFEQNRVFIVIIGITVIIIGIFAMTGMIHLKI